MSGLFWETVKKREENSLIFLLVFSLFLFKSWQAQNCNYIFRFKEHIYFSIFFLVSKSCPTIKQKDVPFT